MAEQQGKTRLPLFDQYSLEDLAARTGYSLSYLCEMHEGRKKPGKRARLFISTILGRPEDELFGSPEGTEATA